MANQQNIAGGDSGNYLQLGNAQSGTISDMVLDVYSQEIFFAAQPVLRFESIATAKTDLSVNPGGRIVFIKYTALSGVSAIAETTTIETESMNSSVVNITVSEHAKALAVSELLIRQAVTDVLADAAILLGMHYAKRRDMQIRDSLYGSPDTESNPDAGGLTNLQLGNGETVYADRAALGGGGDDALMDVQGIRNAVEVLATNKVPKFNGDAYVCFVHPHQGAQIRKSNEWQNVVQYGDPSRVYNGEIGRIEDVRFIETTMTQVIIGETTPSPADTWDVYTDGAQEFTDRAGTTQRHATGANNGGADNQDIYRAIMVGQNCVGVADALPVEMRDNGVEDFGRKHSIAYYAIYGSGLVEDAHGVIIETK